MGGDGCAVGAGASVPRGPVLGLGGGVVAQAMLGARPSSAPDPAVMLSVAAPSVTSQRYNTQQSNKIT